MIISKTPFRVSLFGGSTDYESFYSQNTSLLIGFALDKYCYLLTRKTPKIFNHKSKIMYSSVETVDNNKDIQQIMKDNNISFTIKKVKMLLKTEGAKDKTYMNKRGLNFIKYAIEDSDDEDEENDLDL